MPIPNAERAIIDATKRHSYLLSSSHPVGRFKAAFFVGLGYSPEDWRQLELDFRRQHLSQEPTLEEENPYGQKYTIRATLIGPSGRGAALVSVWVVRHAENVPRFVTAYPGGGR